MTQPIICQRRLLLGSLGATVAFILTGCATPGPTGPTVMALPKQDESFEVFQQHDITCRQYAATYSGGKSPEQAAARNAVGGAAVGAGVGAAAGALIGSASGHAGNGAAIGAGSGLLAGTLLGAGSGRNAGASVQHQYNMAYTQCMVANGDRVSPPPPVYVAPAPVVVPAYPSAPPQGY